MVLNQLISITAILLNLKLGKLLLLTTNLKGAMIVS
jgi:hypothetical protein